MGVVGFLDHVRSRCATSGIELDLQNGVRTTDGNLGTFDQTAKRLSVAVGDKWWPKTLAHELGHLEQYVENHPAFREGAVELWDQFESWSEGKLRLKPQTLLRTTRAIQRCELDAERRAIRTIRQFDLGDIDFYTRHANLYVWKYELTRRMGTWPSYGGDLGDAIAASMPKRLIGQNRMGSPPQELLAWA